MQAAARPVAAAPPTTTSSGSFFDAPPVINDAAFSLKIDPSFLQKPGDDDPFKNFFA
jgi:hypothetical protein